MPTAGHSPARPALARWAGVAFLCTLMLAFLAPAGTSRAATLRAERSAYASSSAPVAAAAKVATAVPNRHACAVGRRIGACKAKKAPKRRATIKRAKKRSKPIKKKHVVGAGGSTAPVAAHGG